MKPSRIPNDSSRVSRRSPGVTWSLRLIATAYELWVDGHGGESTPCTLGFYVAHDNNFIFLFLYSPLNHPTRELFISFYWTMGTAQFIQFECVRLDWQINMWWLFSFKQGISNITPPRKFDEGVIIYIENLTDSYLGVDLSTWLVTDVTYCVSHVVHMRSLFECDSCFNHASDITEWNPSFEIDLGGPSSFVIHHSIQ